ncbi:SWIM zinc finger family protein [Chitinophaga pollutisoli]|uniref:SWIM zinc finger family protein n=1 Tax=Chitinophaga pollutisoli TaxID=3133966 RepID=A0ABZ2YSC6_9BACT
MQLTEDQILSLAPDESSRKSGRELANPSKWVSKGISDIALWGECQGSGSKPYQAQIDLTNTAFKCSCPSRKFPCKHGLGLMLLYARHAAAFTDTTAPAWVIEWMEKRTKHEEKKTEAIAKPVDASAQVKRKETREQQVEDGIAELLRWMKDIVRNGILSMPEKDPGFFSEMARRMIDAKAPGLAGMVRNLGSVGFYREDWQSRFMDQLCRMYLVATGFLNRNALPADLAEDIRSGTGFTQSQETLKSYPGVSDTWIVLGKQTSEEDNLLVEKNWLYGTSTQRYALVLQFSVRGQGLAFSLSAGMYIRAELVYFPSAAPLRAVIREQQSTRAQAAYTSCSGWLEVTAAAAAVYRTLPFDGERPYIVAQLRLVQVNGGWWLADAHNRMVQLKDGFKQLYALLSVSGGRPLDMAVLGREHVYEPLGVWAAGKYHHLSN